jgi:hypothetical protein
VGDHKRVGAMTVPVPVALPGSGDRNAGERDGEDKSD